MDYFEFKKISQSNKKFADVTKDIFDFMRNYHPSLGRISITLLEGCKLSTYHSEDINDSEYYHLEFKAVNIKKHTSLWQLIHSKTYRTIDDIQTLKKNPQIERLILSGYMSSMAIPILYRDEVAGVIFFNARALGYFSSEKVSKDFMYIANVISSLYIQELESRSHFKKLLQVALKVSHHRDPETSQHLIRMGKYSETLARLMAKKCPKITTEFIHRIRFYAPFHDIGKYRIPDEILFSNKIFSQSEREIMKMHSIFGEEIIDEVVRTCNLHNTPDEEIQFVKNIVRFHHEAYDGSGYPDGLKQSNIPLEARIVSLADVFDALLSKRPYKEPWSVSQVIQFIKDKVGILFDPLCVEALINNLDEFLAIQAVVSDECPKPLEHQSHLVSCHN